MIDKTGEKRERGRQGRGEGEGAGRIDHGGVKPGSKTSTALLNIMFIVECPFTHLYTDPFNKERCALRALL